jgi:putative oxidoreductase
MTVAGLTDHRGKGFFIFKCGWEYVGFVGAVAVALAFLGPGR